VIVQGRPGVRYCGAYQLLVGPHHG
jgi:hypothetical protein